MANVEKTEFNLAETSGPIGGTPPTDPTAARRGTINPHALNTETDIETTLRPRSLAEFIGQPKVRDQLNLVLTGAKTATSPPTMCSSPGRPDSVKPPWP